ncbi:protein Flattop [Scomber scombrus]|uniref:protein Flattop n=1 Tax=Scomber scombrus TaxID=13677 RepID=UPI002DD9AA6F|nr:protein Flattop [Scomber scombrus]
MSSSYSASQFDSAYKPQRLQNWCETKPFKQRPTAQEGHTAFIADDRGHLLQGVVKRGSAWPDFKGTWDLPVRIPAHRINPTGRSVVGLNRLKSWGFDTSINGQFQPHRGSRNTDELQDAAKQTNGDEQQDGAAPSSAPTSAAQARPASQTRPITGGERSASQNRDSMAAAFGSDARSAEDKRAIRDSEVEAALRPATGEGTSSRPNTGKGKLVSNVSSVSQGGPSSSKQRQRDEQLEQ